MEYRVTDEKSGEVLGLANTGLLGELQSMRSAVSASIVGCRSCKRSRIILVPIDGFDEPQPAVEWYLEDVPIYGPARKSDEFARLVLLESR